LAINSVGQDSDIYSVGYLIEKILKGPTEVGRRGSETIRLLEICSGMQNKEFKDFGQVIKAIKDASATTVPAWECAPVAETPLYSMDIEEMSEQNGFQDGDSTAKSKREKKDFQAGEKATRTRKKSGDYNYLKLSLMSFFVLISPFLYTTHLYNGNLSSLRGKDAPSKAAMKGKIAQEKYSSQSSDASEKASASDTSPLKSATPEEIVQHPVSEKKGTKTNTPNSAESKLKIIEMESKPNDSPEKENGGIEKAELLEKKLKVSDKGISSEVKIARTVFHEKIKRDVTWQKAATYCNSLRNSSRLPTRQELESSVSKKTSLIPISSLSREDSCYWTSERSKTNRIYLVNIKEKKVVLRDANDFGNAMCIIDGGSASIAGVHVGKKSQSKKRAYSSRNKIKQRYVKKHPVYMDYPNYFVRQPSQGVMPPSQGKSESFDSGGQVLAGWPSH
jgi:hypothetical protein